MPHRTDLDRDRLSSALDAVLDRVEDTLDETGDAFPYVVDPATGAWRTTADGNWAAGHWIGLLWLAAHHADDGSRFAAAARSHTEAMCVQDFDNIFLGMGLHYAGFRGYDATGDRSLFGLGLAGADEMQALFDEAARQIPIGEYVVAHPGASGDDETEESGDDAEEREEEGAGEGEGGAAGAPLTRYAAVDIVYTSLPVLWRAYRETGDERFRDTAVSHADRHLDWHVRPDGSTRQITVFGPSGGIERRSNDLAAAADTTWARGMGWHLAGLARAYSETGADRYLDVLERSVGYYREHSPPDLVPRWDFEAPDESEEPRDTSAAALAAYGLARIRGDGERVAALRRTGERILDSLVADYLVTDPDDDRYGAVLHGTFNRPADYGVDTELVWTNYYVAYALHDLLA